MTSTTGTFPFRTGMGTGSAISQTSQAADVVSKVIAGIIIAMLALYVLAFLVIWLAVREYGKRRRRVAEADPTMMARKRLRSIATHCKSAESAMEQGRNEEDDDTKECPICLEPLRLASPSGRDITSEARKSGAKSDRHRTKSQLLREKIKAVSAKVWPWTDDWSTFLSDTDILSLRQCCHSFHAGCLVSWFAKQRHDCPVCRRRYWAKLREHPAPPPTALRGGRMGMPLRWGARGLPHLSRSADRQ